MLDQRIVRAFMTLAHPEVIIVSGFDFVSPTAVLIQELLMDDDRFASMAMTTSDDMVIYCQDHRAVSDIAAILTELQVEYYEFVYFDHD